MRIAILSDIHANAYALQAVLADTEEQEVEEYWVLGDFVGYGPHPLPPLRFLHRYVCDEGWVLGNHDAMLADLFLPEEADKASLKVHIQNGAGPEIGARGLFLKAGEWEETNSTPVEALFLNLRAIAQDTEIDAWWRTAFLPQRVAPRVLERDGLKCVLVHASQSSPLSQYIYPWHSEISLPREFQMIEQKVGQGTLPVVQFYGHTHVPAFIAAQRDGENLHIQPRKIFPDVELSLENGHMYLVNPGSVGQPRDFDRRAAYLICDTQSRTIRYRRVAYDYTRTAEDLAVNGYPDSLIRRLRDAPLVNEAPPEWSEHYRKAVGYG